MTYQHNPFMAPGAAAVVWLVSYCKHIDRISIRDYCGRIFRTRVYQETAHDVQRDVVKNNERNSEKNADCSQNEYFFNDI